jgi:hypothetical protein
MRRVIPTAITALIGSGGPALACTICHTETSLGVRHQFFEHDLLSNAAAVAAPVPILLAAVLLLARDPGKRTRIVDGR